MRGSDTRNYLSASVARLEEQIRDLRGSVAGGFTYLVNRAPVCRNTETELKILWGRAGRMASKNEWTLAELASLADMCHRRSSADLALMAGVVGQNDCWVLILSILQEGQFLVGHHPRYSEDAALQALDTKLQAAVIRIEQAAMIMIFRKKPELHAYLQQKVDQEAGPLRIRRVLRDPLDNS